MGKLSRTKGVAYERKIAQAFKDIGYVGAKRHLEYQVDEAHGIDLDGTGPYKVQCKKTKKYVSLNTIKEIKCNRKAGDVPVLIAGADNQPSLVVVHLEDFLEILTRANELTTMRQALQDSKKALSGL